MAKKRTTTRKSAATPRRPAKASPRKRDSSQLDLKPLQSHIKRRLKDLDGKTVRSATARKGELTADRLKDALQLLEDLCFPTMTIPI